LFQPFVVTDACVAAGRKNIDEAIFGNHLQSDLGVSFEKGRNNRGQHQPRSAHRNIEP
jgi:hypothetical protein